MDFPCHSQHSTWDSDYSSVYTVLGSTARNDLKERKDVWVFMPILCAQDLEYLKEDSDPTKLLEIISQGRKTTTTTKS